MIKFNCPACGKKLAVPDEFANKKARCPGCQQIITIPQNSSAPYTGDATKQASDPMSPPPGVKTQSAVPGEIKKPHAHLSFLYLGLAVVALVGIVGGILALTGVFNEKSTSTAPSSLPNRVEQADAKKPQDKPLSLDDMEKMSPQQLQEAQQHAEEEWKKAWADFRTKIENLALELQQTADVYGTQNDRSFAKGWRESLSAVLVPEYRIYDPLFITLLHEEGIGTGWYGVFIYNNAINSQIEYLSLEALRAEARELIETTKEAEHTLLLDIPRRSILGQLALVTTDAIKKSASDDQRKAIVGQANAILDKGSFSERDRKAFARFLNTLQSNIHPNNTAPSNP